MTTTANNATDKPGSLPGETLGTVQLRHQLTNEIILVPTPSGDPNDPLNWVNGRKYYIFALTCLSIFSCNICAPGPSVAVVDLAIEFFGAPDDPRFLEWVGKIAYMFTGASLTIGIGVLFWVPLAIKYGRRPVYLCAFSLLTASCIWCGVAKSYGSELAARLVLGIAAGAPEIVAPLTITDIFFLHQRGAVMAFYNCALSCGVGVGIVIFGLVLRMQTWRTIYWICTALTGLCTVLMFFTFPETAYNRNRSTFTGDLPARTSQDLKREQLDRAQEVEALPYAPFVTTYKKQSFVQQLKVLTHVYTDESLGLLVLRPVVCLALPGVLWATLINSVTIGMIVVLSSNFTAAFQQAYGFEAWQSGLTFISTIVGSLMAIAAGGHFSDWMADKLTQRNNGVRVPEMRLPALIISLVTGPLACVLYGVGIAKRLHWMCAVIGIGLVNFTVVQSNNISVVYILDSYRPIAGEVVVTQAAFKACFGFLLSFYTNPWVEQSGYAGAFGAMAGIVGGVLICFIPFYIFGARIRRASWRWPFIRKVAHWSEDREVGE
ncbi:uncharacterized protein Z518_03464 [Rhinocladiella mackenziei CBS 650.93]|uniref:Rhinocladiella mackenziei CBS 650.93 unplaced genomic scaffold supercont1.2, whole genome shotgun sequence n=1 Tax=Rhinocladiella mackenziei CBS 650.93 TaxID=1442369 RepID=A0A0D2G2M9_9EURO|nr:uncharacterized protein Z518_03464 [Rhinocladiella mackenziei CBS 650.93]KIX08807.1 hypothetical protein Z518_03464 [Rhinocladiella mackenziei CBS 650.93]